MCRYIIDIFCYLTLMNYFSHFSQHIPLISVTDLNVIINNNYV